MAELIHQAFGQYLEKTPQDPEGYEAAMHFDKESDYSWSRGGDPVQEIISDAVGVSSEIAEDVQDSLVSKYWDYDDQLSGVESDYGDEARYIYQDPGFGRWQSVWDEFVRSLKFEARLFSTKGVEQLSAILGGIERLDTPSGRSVLVEIGPGSPIKKLFRARVFQSDAALKAALAKPDEELGPPPSHAASAGRMNARGVSVFYGATSRKTALGEVRPPVGSLVAIARFDIVRKLRVLDFSAFEGLTPNVSLFDPAYSETVTRALFLRSLGKRLASAVMPDEQHFDYLPTQAVADFLATGRLLPLDGVMFSSVQAGGKGLNVVLFHNASRVRKLKVSENTEVKVTTVRELDEGYYRSYGVEWLACEGEEATGETRDVCQPKRPPSPRDERKPSLRINMAHIEIRDIDRARYKTTKFSVRHKGVTKKGKLREK
ncbi:RES family NAD+ phosphorylase [Rhizobium sp. S163]|uniref:RES family NAD+ phosphorylase n=1 Tax=Rhizobium sp. S163 TaxID=3055039 RepID=UPI00339D3254